MHTLDMELTWEAGSEEHIAEAFNVHVDTDGYLRDSGDYVKSIGGSIIHRSELVKVLDDDGKPVFVRNTTEELVMAEELQVEADLRDE